MTMALERLFDCFGLVGMASVGGWLLADVLVVAYALRWRRTSLGLAALVLAGAALVAATVNSYHISAIRTDFKPEVRATKEQGQHGNPPQQQLSDSGLSEQAQQAKRVEAADKEQTPDQAPKQAATPDNPSLHAYRQAGKVQRTEGKASKNKFPIRADNNGQPVARTSRAMSMRDVAHANRLDRLNLFLARWTVVLAAGLMVVDYFRRFNSTFDCYLPLPLSGRLVDAFFSKSHSVRHAGRRPPREFLEQAVRKGETFILFADRDPWRERFLARLPRYVPSGWSLEKVTLRAEGFPFDTAFLFESAWFGRYGFVIVGEPPHCAQLLDSLAGFLEVRQVTRAAAHRTVNIVWDLPAEIPPATLERLLATCRETNFRLVVARGTPVDALLAARFEESHA